MLEGAGRNFFEGAMRTGASVLRGYMEAKVAVAQAKTQSQLQRANARLAQARNDLLRQQNEITKGLGEAQIESNERIAEEERKAQQFNVVTTTEGKKYIVDAQGQSAAEVADIQAGAAKSVAETGAESAESVAQIQGQAGVKQAEIGAQASENVAQTQAGAQVQAAQGASDAGVKVAQINKESAIEVAAKQAEALTGVADIKAQAEIDKAFYENLAAGGDGLGTVSAEASRFFMSVQAAASRSDAYKLVNASQAAAQRAIELYKDGGSPAKDITFMNMFQRVIDPGVSVREGDVQLQQSTMPYVDQIKATMTRMEQGLVLTNSMRQQHMESLMALANADYDLLMPRIEQTVASQLSQNAELVQSGRNTAESLFYLKPQRFEGTPMVDEGTGAVTLGAATQTGVGADGRMPQEPQQAQTGAESKIPALVQWAQLRMSEGQSGQEVRQALVDRLDKTVSDPAMRQQILEAVDSQVQWEQARTPERRGAPRPMNKRRQ